MIWKHITYSSHKDVTGFLEFSYIFFRDIFLRKAIFDLENFGLQFSLNSTPNHSNTHWLRWIHRHQTSSPRSCNPKKLLGRASRPPLLSRSEEPLSRRRAWHMWDDGKDPASALTDEGELVRFPPRTLQHDCAPPWTSARAVLTEAAVLLGRHKPWNPCNPAGPNRMCSSIL
jgi:hypothetical protein